MTGEEGKEAGGSTPTGASLHPSAVHAQPIKGRIVYWGRSRREHRRRGRRKMDIEKKQSMSIARDCQAEQQMAGL